MCLVRSLQTCLIKNAVVSGHGWPTLGLRFFRQLWVSEMPKQAETVVERHQDHSPMRGQRVGRIKRPAPARAVVVVAAVNVNDHRKLDSV